MLSDHRRVNVLLSRAKHKLVMVGSACTLGYARPASPPAPTPAGQDADAPAREPICASLLSELRNKNWIYALGPEAQISGI